MPRNACLEKPFWQGKTMRRELSERLSIRFVTNLPRRDAGMEGIAKIAGHDVQTML
jgi:hypothetical protein